MDFIENFLKLPESSRQKVQEALLLLQNVGCSGTEVNPVNRSNNSKAVIGLLKTSPSKPASSQKTLDQWIVRNRSPLNSEKENPKLFKERVLAEPREETQSNFEATVANACTSKSITETNNLPCSSASSSHEEHALDIHSVESANKKKLVVLIERQDLQDYFRAPEVAGDVEVASEKLSSETIGIDDNIKSKVVADSKNMKTSDRINFSPTNQSEITEQNKASTKKQTESSEQKKCPPVKQTKSPIPKKTMEKELVKFPSENQSVHLTKSDKSSINQCENREQDADISSEDEPRSYNLRSARRGQSEKPKPPKSRTTNTPNNHIVQSCSVTESGNSGNISNTNVKLDPKRNPIEESSVCSGIVNLESVISSCSNEGSNNNKRSVKISDGKIDSGIKPAEDLEVSIKHFSAETNNIVMDEIPVTIKTDFNQVKRKRKITVSSKIDTRNKPPAIEQDMEVSAKDLYATIAIEADSNQAKRTNDKKKKKQLDFPKSQHYNEGLNAESSDISRTEVISGEDVQSTTRNTTVQLVDESINTLSSLKRITKKIPKTVVKTPANKKRMSKRNISESVPKQKKDNEGRTCTGSSLNEAVNQDLPPNADAEKSNLLNHDIVPNVKQNAQMQLELVNNSRSLSSHLENDSNKNSEHLLTEKIEVTQSSINSDLVLPKKKFRKKCAANKKEFASGTNENPSSPLVSGQHSSHPVNADSNSSGNSLGDNINENQTEKASPKAKYKRSRACKSMSTTEKKQSTLLITHNLPANSQCRNRIEVESLSAESVIEHSEVTENQNHVPITTHNQLNSKEGEGTCIKQTLNLTTISPTVPKTKRKKTACTKKGEVKDTHNVESFIPSQGTESFNIISIKDISASDLNSAPGDKVIPKSLKKGPEILKTSSFQMQDSETDLQKNLLNSDCNTPQTECSTTNNALEQLGSSKKKTLKHTKPARSKQLRVRRKEKPNKSKGSPNILQNISKSSSTTVLLSQKNIAASDSEPDFLSPKTHFRRGIKRKLRPLLTGLVTTTSAANVEADSSDYNSNHKQLCKHKKLTEELSENHNKIIRLKNSLLDNTPVSCEEDDILCKSQARNISSENLDFEKAVNTRQNISLLTNKDSLGKEQNSPSDEISDSNEKAETSFHVKKNKNFKMIIQSIKKKNFSKGKKIIKKHSLKKNSRIKSHASSTSAEFVSQMCDTNTELGYCVDSEKIQDKNENTASDKELLDEFSESTADVLEKMDVTVECTTDQDLIKETDECTVNISAQLNCTEETNSDIIQTKLCRNSGEIYDKMKLNYVAFVHVSKTLATIDVDINNLFQNSKMVNSIKSIPSNGCFIFKKKEVDSKDSVIVYMHESKKELKEIICKLKKTEEVK